MIILLRLTVYATELDWVLSSFSWIYDCIRDIYHDDCSWDQTATAMVKYNHSFGQRRRPLRADFFLDGMAWFTRNDPLYQYSGGTLIKRNKNVLFLLQPS